MLSKSRDYCCVGRCVNERLGILRAWTLPTTFAFMSKAEILEQLPTLNPTELQEIRDRIWQLEEEELLKGRAQPSDEEKALLDAEFDDFALDPTSGSSWEEVKSRLKK
jgi:hypothetical protein